MATDFVPTRASVLKNNAPKEDYLQVAYVSHKSKKKEKQEAPTEQETENSNELLFNIQKAKHEVVKLGMSGFDPVKKEEAKIQQLIKLGAKPPKNKYKNYKQLLLENRKKKEKTEKELMFKQLGKNKLGKATAKGKSFDRKRRKEGILDIYGKIVKQNTSDRLTK